MRYILYDHDMGDLATTTVYASYEEAVDDASQLDNVIVLALPFEQEVAQEVAPVCECEQPGHFRSGVPGILACVENGRLAEGAKVERCDSCRRYPSDKAAFEKLIELGIASREPAQDSARDSARDSTLPHAKRYVEMGGGFCPSVNRIKPKGIPSTSVATIARNVCIALSATPYGPTSTPCLPLNPESDAGL